MMVYRTSNVQGCRGEINVWEVVAGSSHRHFFRMENTINSTNKSGWVLFLVFWTTNFLQQFFFCMVLGKLDPNPTMEVWVQKFTLQFLARWYQRMGEATTWFWLHEGVNLPATICNASWLSHSEALPLNRLRHGAPTAPETGWLTICGSHNLTCYWHDFEGWKSVGIGRHINRA